MTVGFRCSAAARLRGDQLAGTASVVRSFLLLEESGPWGREAWLDARLPSGLGAEVLRRAEAAGVRPLLIRRRSASASTEHRKVFAANVKPTGAELFEGSVTDPRELLDLDFTAFGADLSVTDQPLFLVCIHGRHDACCAERGRPVFTALQLIEPETVWGASHLGGDRFAANLVALPDGLYFGGLDPHNAPTVVSEYQQGRLAIEQFRGRSCWPMPVQAAEIELQRHRGDFSTDGYHLLSRQQSDAGLVVRFGTPGGVQRVLVRRLAQPDRQLTCTAERLNPLIRWHCVVLGEGQPG